MAFRLPRNPNLVGIPTVLSLVYLTSYSTAPIFSSVRARLPLWTTEYAVPVLFWIHVIESCLAAFRSNARNQPLSITVKWFLSTMVWGFASLEAQKKALKI